MTAPRSPGLKSDARAAPVLRHGPVLQRLTTTLCGHLTPQHETPDMTDALPGFAAVFALALLRLPLAAAMGFVGYAGLDLLRGWGPTAASAAQVVQDTGFASPLSVVPRFILMGKRVAKAGLAQALFGAAPAVVGHHGGGLAHTTVLACAGFGAICGAAIATAAAMTRVAYPATKKRGDADFLSTGVIAAGGTRAS